MDTKSTGVGRFRPAHLVRRLLVDSPESMGAKARRRRWEIFMSHFPEIDQMHVVDLGGTVESWRRAPVRPARVTVVNLFEPGPAEDPWAIPVTGDACQASTALEQAGANASFDLVYSNSLIEHVGGHAMRSALADQIATLARWHWVQTPYRYFPIEPHWLFPFMQFLPDQARTEIAYRWPLVNTRPPSLEVARSEVLWTELVSLTAMRAYFPNSEIICERVAGLTKSLTAVISATSSTG